VRALPILVRVCCVSVSRYNCLWVNLRFAVSAPRGIELNQDVFGVVKNDILVRVCYDNCDRTLLFLWNRLRLDAGFQVAINKVLDKCANSLLCELALEWVFLVLDRLLDGECRPSVCRKVEVSGMSAECLCVDGGKVDFALIFLGDWLQGSREFGSLFRRFGEDVC